MQTRRGNVRRAPSVASMERPLVRSLSQRARPQDDPEHRAGNNDPSMEVRGPPVTGEGDNATPLFGVDPITGRADSVASSAGAMQRDALLQALSSIQAQLAPLVNLPQRVNSLADEITKVSSATALAAPTPQSQQLELPTATASGSNLSFPKPAPLRVTVPTFEGTLGRWEPFWRQFSSVRTLLQWDQVTAGHMLLAHLRDSALEAVMAMPEPRDDLSRLEAFLSSRFGAAAAIDVCQAQLEGRTRRQNEDLYAFARDVEALARRTYPSSSEELIQREALAVFLSGCWRVR